MVLTWSSKPVSRWTDCAHFSARRKKVALLALKYVYKKSHSFFPFKSGQHGKCIFKPRLQICVPVYTPTFSRADGFETCTQANLKCSPPLTPRRTSQNLLNAKIESEQANTGQIWVVQAHEQDTSCLDPALPRSFLTQFMQAAASAFCSAHQC